MAHPAKPDDHQHLRSILRRLNSDSWSGWHGHDLPVVEDEDMDVDEMIRIVDSRASGRLEEYEENQSFTKPSRERREARQHAEHRIEQGETTW